MFKQQSETPDEINLITARPSLTITFSALRWGSADAEIKVLPFDDNPDLSKVSPFKPGREK